MDKQSAYTPDATWVTGCHPNSETDMTNDSQVYAVPGWLEPFLSKDFSVKCNVHPNVRKPECKMYCLDCADGALCSTCVCIHSDHRVVQIRRSSYHDVVRVAEIESHLDISLIQAYTINNARVIFLNERRQSKPPRYYRRRCNACGRGLHDNLPFCSLGCKFKSHFNKVCVDEESSRMVASSVRHKDFNSRHNCDDKAKSVHLRVVGGIRKHRRKGIPIRSPLY